MRKAAGVLGLVAGVLGAICSLAVTAVDRLGLGVVAKAACPAITGHNATELGLSTMCIGLGVLVMCVQSRRLGVFLFATALAGIIVGDIAVAICMALALAAGVLAAMPDRRRAVVTQVSPGACVGQGERQG